MTKFDVGAASLALLATGVIELAASTRGRSAVDAIGEIAVAVSPLPLVEWTIRLTGTTDKPLIRTVIVSAAATTAGLALGRSGPRAVRPAVATVASAAGIAAYVAGRKRLDAARSRQDALRAQVTVASPLADVSDGAEQWEHAEPLFTDVNRFYATDVNLRPPLVDVDDWQLELNGLRGDRGAVSYGELLALPLQERDALLACVHQRLGWDRLGYQRWTGIPVGDLFAAAGVELPADTTTVDLVMEAVDGYRQVLPLDEALDGGSWLVLGMDRKALSAAHGFPARVMTPGLVGQYSGVKWLRSLSLAPSGIETATWVGRGWPSDAVVPPPMARIDYPGEVGMPPRLPKRMLDVSPALTATGTAWAPAHGGVADVQIRLDGGVWTSAELANDLGPYAWRRWRAPLNLTQGRHELAVRCIAHDGTIQSGLSTNPFPNGTAGHHTLALNATATLLRPTPQPSRSAKIVPVESEKTSM